MSCGYEQISENYHHLNDDMSYRTQYDKDMYKKFCAPLGPCKVEHFEHGAPVKLNKHHQNDNHHVISHEPSSFRTTYDQDMQKKFCGSCPKQHFFNTKDY